MVNNTSNTSSTNTTIIHDDGNWSNAIRSIFIYGVGAFRFSLGTPASRAFVVVSTIAGEAGAKIINNAINDPEYIKNHYRSWTISWVDKDVVRIDIS